MDFAPPIIEPNSKHSVIERESQRLCWLPQLKS
nr:MAG TPA: hypothetical protein [Caudoviricetes sp.]